MLDALIGLIAPFTCLMCGREGRLLCETCFDDAIDPVPSRCYRCSAQTVDSAVCRTCRRASPLRQVWVTTVYDGPPKELVERLKFGRTKQAAAYIARYLDQTVATLPDNTLVTFVPTATGRIRQRGYDHAQLIAKDFAERRGLRCAPLLLRHGQARQVGSDRAHRMQQASTNYSHNKKPCSLDTPILLIDDILTTGATMESAAKVLKTAGFKTINAAVFAQKQ